MAEKNEGELQKPIEIKNEPILAESEETLDAQIDRGLENLNLLIGKLEFNIGSSLDAKEREEMVKEKDDFLKKIGKLGKKSTESKLKKIMKLREEMEIIIGDEIAIEEKDKKEFDDLVAATNKCLEDLRKKYELYISENKLGDFEKKQFDQIILEYEELIQEAVSKTDNKKLEEIGSDIKANLEGDIEIEEEEIEIVNNDKKTENENFDKEAIMQDFNSFFAEIHKKYIKFEQIYKDIDSKSCENLRKSIEHWAKKINDFEKIKSHSAEDVARIMQLHDEVKKWVEESWTELHRAGKFELATRNELEKNREKAKNMEEKYAFSRKVADIARVKTDNYEKLNGATEKERDENFKNEIKRILKDNLVVHGKLREKDAGELYVDKKPDLDCKASLELIKMAKIDLDNKKIHYEREGGSVSGRINIDTGGMDGLVVLEDGTVFIDHHGKESSNRTSATEKTLEVLISAGLLKDLKFLRNLVSFVNKVDNFDYPENYYKNYFTDSWKTMYGLSKMLDGNELRRFFEYKDSDGKPLDPGEPMNDELMRKIGVIRTIKNKKTGEETLINKPASHKERVMEAKEELEKMEKEGFIIDSERYGKICLNVDGRMKCGTDAAKAFGCDTYLAWNKNNNFFISSLNGKKLEDDFVNGLNVRGIMWINPLDNERKITLTEILAKMTDGKFVPGEAVKNILEGNVKAVGDVENKDIEVLVEPALTDLSHEEIGHPGGIDAKELIPTIDEFEIEDNGMLSKEEGVELKNFITEKISEFRNQLNQIEYNFGEFLEKNLKESEFNHLIQKEIIGLGEFLKELQEVKESDYNTHMGSEKVLALINKIDDLIKISTPEKWSEELDAFKEGFKKEDLEFTEKEQKIVEKSKELIDDFIGDFREKFNWDNFPKGKIEEFLNIQAMVFLMKTFATKKWFIGIEENVAELIIKNRNRIN